MTTNALAPAAQAFDAIAASFDDRFGEWKSVAAQRRAVRRELLRIFPKGGDILEIGGGTGEDAVWLAEHGYRVQLTDPSPSMVEIAQRKLLPLGAPAPRCAPAESLAMDEEFDGAFSNFAALNCVTDLSAVARGLARAVKSGGAAVLVLFGTFSPGEWIVEAAHGRPRAAFRRFTREPVSARLGGREFTVRYHRTDDVRSAFQPWFELESRKGIGICVPPSAAEPWISRHARVLNALERIDRLIARPLSPLGDHVLYVLRRTGARVEGASA
jgi:ubiquinone/menaquinone biosynthesis C-methylase UbiE